MSSSWLDGLTHETVIVHLKGNSHSLKGVLAAVHADCLVLRDVAVLDPEDQAMLDGSVVVLRENVDFMQVIRGGES